VSILKSKVHTIKQFKDNLRYIIKFSDLNNDTFYTEEGTEVDENYLNGGIHNNEIIIVFPAGKRYVSSVKMLKYEFISELRKKPSVTINLAKDVLTGGLYFIKNIECVGLGNYIYFICL